MFYGIAPARATWIRSKAMKIAGVPPHLHIVATIVESPRPGDCDRSNNWFSGIDPETLTDIDNPDYRLEVVDNTGCQLDLF